MMPPEKISGSFTVKKLYDWLNRLRDWTISFTPRQGHGTRVHHSTLGTMTSAQPGEKTIEGGGGLKYRGDWSTFVHYKEDDVVIVRRPISGLGSVEMQGTYISIREHDSDDTNYPRELTKEGVDPGTGALDDTWRTLAAGAWPELYIRAFPIQVEGGPPIVLLPYTHLAAGTVGCFGGSGTSGIAGLSYLNGSASGSKPGTGQWELSAQDLPTGEIAKFRLLTLCIGGEKFTAYFAMTAPVPVP